MCLHSVLLDWYDVFRSNPNAFKTKNYLPIFLPLWSFNSIFIRTILYFFYLFILLDYLTLPCLSSFSTSFSKTFHIELFVSVAHLILATFLTFILLIMFFFRIISILFWYCMLLEPCSSKGWGNWIDNTSKAFSWLRSVYTSLTKV
jgi:hypothetical protein